MAAADKEPVALSAPITEVLDVKKELSDKPIKIHIPQNLNHYKINLKYLAAVYQEILLDTCKGKVSDRQLEQIEKLSTELISTLV